MAIEKRIYYGEDPQCSLEGPAFFWPASDQKRRELYSVRRNHPDVYESVYQCRPGTRIGSVFLETDFVYYMPPSDLSAGIADPEIRKFVQKFQKIVAAWDTAFEAHNSSSYTVGLVAGLLPCESYHRGEDPQVFGPCEPHLDVYLLDIVRDKWAWGELPKEFRRLHRKWGIDTHVVEKRGVGISLYQSMPTIGIMVEGVEVKESKRARAMEGVEAGSTQGWFRQHRVYAPLNVPWLDRYKIELKDFTGDGGGRDDQVDATVHLVNYAIQIGSAVFILPSNWTPETVDQIMEAETPMSASTIDQVYSTDIIGWLGAVESFHENPLIETCGYCHNNKSGYCSFQGRPVAIFDSCLEWTAIREDDDVRA